LAARKTRIPIGVKETKQGDRSVLAPQGQSPLAEAATTVGSHNQLEQSGDKPERRLMMAADTKTGTNGHFDVTEMAKTWKEGYLKGLEASLQWQERNEHLIKETVRQGLAVPHHWFTASKSLFGKPGDELLGQTTGVSNPFVALTRQVLQTSQDIAEPLLKTAADACETSFNYYETAVAGPARKYAVEINKKMMDTVISD
jgi:hypothetical protein